MSRAISQKVSSFGNRTRHPRVFELNSLTTRPYIRLWTSIPRLEFLRHAALGKLFTCHCLWGVLAADFLEILEWVNQDSRISLTGYRSSVPRWGVVGHKPDPVGQQLLEYTRLSIVEDRRADVSACRVLLGSFDRFLVNFTRYIELSHTTNQVKKSNNAWCMMHHSSCIMYHASCIMHHASCIMQHASWNLHHASCNLHHATLHHASCTMHHTP